MRSTTVPCFSRARGILWLLAAEFGDAKLGAEVLLGPSNRDVGDMAFAVTNGGVVLVAERVETSAAGRLVVDQVETMENGCRGGTRA